MAKKKQKLELTWIGKDKRPKLEPRILIEDPEKSYHASERRSDADIFDNILIHGDNLLALKSLEQDYAGKVKCIYIDPPFNTGQAFDHYDDGLEHSVWLSLMGERLQYFHRLLSPDGFFWLHLDDVEVHYAKVLADECFGRENFVNQITYERSGSAGLGQGGAFVDTAEYILLYRKSHEAMLNSVSGSTPLDQKTMKRYRKVLQSEGGREIVDEFIAKSNELPVKLFKHKDYEINSISLKSFEQRQDEIESEYVDFYSKIFRTTNPQKENSFQNDLINRMEQGNLYSVDYVPSRGKYANQPTTLYYFNREIFAWLKDSAELVDNKVVKTNKLTNIWTHADIPKADLANEGGVDFRRGKKPENLLKRIIALSTKPGDTVLDSFAGSGSTGAVAHKMGRRWIMVEIGEHCTTHAAPRLQKVVDAEDPSGVTNAVDWRGGGGFRYFRLAPSLLEHDKYGNWVISKDYKPEMLAEAMCKHMGFTYAPSQNPDEYWNHGYSTEADFIFVTTQNLTHQALAKIAEDVGPDRSLLICCKAFNANPDAFDNLTIKKIPHAVLKKCEWGHDDYSLNVANLPMAADDDVEDAHPSVPPDDLPLFATEEEDGGEG